MSVREEGGKALLIVGLVMIWVSWLLTAYLNSPGHMSYDPLFTLREAREGLYSGSQPVVISMLMRTFDKIVPGTALYLLFVNSVYYIPITYFISRLKSISWLALTFVALACFSPLLLIYQGIIWKDVFFTNAIIGAFLIVASQYHRPSKLFASIASISVAVILVVVALLLRPNSLVVVPPFALLLAAVVGKPRSSIPLFVGKSVACMLTIVAIMIASAALLPGPKDQTAKNLRPILTYDIAAQLAKGASPQILRQFGVLDDQVVVDAMATYTPERWDYLWRTPRFFPAIQALDFDELTSLWADLVRADLGSYAQHRLATFQWLLFSPVMNLCLPAITGISEAGELNATVGIPAGQRPSDIALYSYLQPLFQTPLWSHAFYLVVSVVLVGVGLVLRLPGRLAGVTLILGGWAFTLTWLLVGVACDYRYLILLDLSLPIAALLFLTPRPPTREKPLQPLPSG